MQVQLIPASFAGIDAWKQFSIEKGFAHTQKHFSNPSIILR